MTSFTGTVWHLNRDLLARIHDLPFNRELAAGTLAPDRFKAYMIQDSLYLKEYGKALALAAARMRDPADLEVFAGSAIGTAVVERSLHESYFATFGISSEEAAAAEPSPTCFAYTNFLLATAQTGSVEELVAAILPCFWVYWDVGKAIEDKAGPDNPYSKWVETYADPQFGEAVRKVITITDRLADAATEPTRERMALAFKRSTQYEWMFWDAAYRLEGWPV